jgi:hypothetical protein
MTIAAQETVVWGTADRAFTTELGRRLQHAFGSARFVEVPKARTLVSLDAPGQTPTPSPAARSHSADQAHRQAVELVPPVGCDLERSPVSTARLEMAGLMLANSDRTPGAHHVLRALARVAAAWSKARILAVSAADSQTKRHW